MFAKQTIVSASLVIVLGTSALARAEPDVTVLGNGEAIVQPPGATDPVPDPPPHTPTGAFTVGAGFSTDENFIARASVSQSNLFGTGNLLALDALVSSRRQLFRIRFADPNALGSQLLLGADLYDDRRVLPGFTREAIGSSVSLTHPIADHLVGFVGYRFEHISAEPDPAPVIARADAIEPALRGGAVSALRGGLAYSTLDAPVMPLRGSSVGASLEVADPRLGSQIEMTRIDAWANTHQALGPFTLHLGGTISAVGSRDPLGVPISERLFLDGSSDIRGYAPGALGPIDPVTGRSIGGNLELTGRAALEAPVIRSIGLSAEGFFDAGAIYDRYGQGAIGRSAGFGLIWRSPIGPLRFDLAYPLDGGPPRFVFGFGSAF